MTDSNTQAHGAVSARAFVIFFEDGESADPQERRA